MISEYTNRKLRLRFQLALLLSAVRDSLGWPQEFTWKKPENSVKNYKKWKKLVGGKYWGYEDVIIFPFIIELSLK